jgi:hypothetical protein
MKPAQEDGLRALNDAAKNWLAMDGLWFQTVEDAHGRRCSLTKEQRERYVKGESEELHFGPDRADRAHSLS